MDAESTTSSQPALSMGEALQPLERPPPSGAACAHCARVAPTHACLACQRPHCARCTLLTFPAPGGARWPADDPLLHCLDCHEELQRQARVWVVVEGEGEEESYASAASSELCCFCGAWEPGDVYACEVCAQLFCGSCSQEVEGLRWPAEGVRRCLHCLEGESISSSDSGGEEGEEEEELRSEVPMSAEERVSWGLWERVMAGEAPPHSLTAAAAASNLLRLLREEVKGGGGDARGERR